MARDLAAAVPVASGWLFVVLWVLVAGGFAVPHLLAEPWSGSILGPMRSFAEVLLAVLIGLATLRASRHIQWLAFVLLSSTAWLVWRAQDWSLLERGLRASLAVGAFLPVVALLRACAQTSAALPGIRQRVGDMTQPQRRAWMTAGAHLLASIITLGYVSIMRPMLPGRIDESERRILAQCGVRGLGLSIVWSPFFVATAVATQWVPGVAAWQTVLLGSLLALVGAAIAHHMFNRRLGIREWLLAMRKLAPIFVPVMVLVAAVVCMSSLARISSLLSVVLTVPVICLMYLLVCRPQQLSAVGAELVRSAGRMGDEVIIMTVSVLFGVAVGGLSPPEFVGELFSRLAEVPLLLIMLMSLAIVGLGLLGLHPMVTASVIVPLSVSQQVPLAAPVLAHIVIFAWALSATVSAWTVPVVVTAAAFEVPVRELTVGPNLRFIVVYGLVGCLVLAAVNRFFEGPIRGVS